MGHADTGAGAVFAADISPKCCGTHDAIDARVTRALADVCRTADGARTNFDGQAIGIIAGDRRDRDINKDSLEDLMTSRRYLRSSWRRAPFDSVYRRWNG